jgi:starvation-inducible outer membrane lipoprotein
MKKATFAGMLVITLAVFEFVLAGCITPPPVSGGEALVFHPIQTTK